LLKSKVKESGVRNCKQNFEKIFKKIAFMKSFEKGNKDINMSFDMSLLKNKNVLTINIIDKLFEEHINEEDILFEINKPLFYT